MTNLPESSVSSNAFASSLVNDERCGITAAYEPVSPLIIDMGANGLDLSEPVVSFDIRGRGTPMLVGWTTVLSDDSFLVLDRNGDGAIDSGRELFGNWTPLSADMQGNILAGDGFTALGVFDQPVNGGDGDALITSADCIFRHLRVWRDGNADGRSEPEELRTLAAVGIHD
jgi:hypothetical protein